MSNLAFSVPGRLLSLCKSMPIVKNTSSSDGVSWSNSTNSDGFKGDRFKLVAKFAFVTVPAISTCRPSSSPVSLLLERRRDLGFALFLCRLLVVVIPWGLERQTFAQWLSLWQFMHLDPYTGHLSRGLRGCSRPQLLHFTFVGFLSLLYICLFTIPFMAFMSFFSLSSCSSCHVVVLFVLAMSMASSKVSCSSFSVNPSWIFLCFVPTMSCSMSRSSDSILSLNVHFEA